MDLVSKLTSFMPWNWVNYNINISLKHQYVYIEVPKAACTTIKSTLSKFELGALATQWDAQGAPGRRVHRGIFESPFIKPYQIDHDMLQHILTGPDFFKFTFVRSPYSRTLSCYLDKVVKKAPIDEHIRQSITKNSAGTSEVSYLDFLKAISSMSTYDMNSHYRPQYQQTFGDTIKFDFIGKQENFAQDFKRLREMIGCPETCYSIANRHKTNASLSTSDYYSEEAAQLTEKIYQQDFRHFNYNKSL